MEMKLGVCLPLSCESQVGNAQYRGQEEGDGDRGGYTNQIHRKTEF